MIHYNLRCIDDGHDFDGWFKDSSAFDRVKKNKLLECPCCGSPNIEKALMAPRVSTGDKAEPAAPLEMSDEMKDWLRRVHKEIEDNCEYVGDHLAAETIRMAENPDLARPIYGHTTPDEDIMLKESETTLRESGINVVKLPNPDLPSPSAPQKRGRKRTTKNKGPLQ